MASALVIGVGKPKEKSVDLDAKESALKDMFEAMQSDDWGAAAEAFQAAYDICKSKSADEEYESVADE